jgi:hypothetical protein
MNYFFAKMEVIFLSNFEEKMNSMRVLVPFVALPQVKILSRHFCTVNYKPLSLHSIKRRQVQRAYLI